MQTLITGNRGFIGSHLSKLCPGAVGLDLKDGIDVRDTIRGDYDYIFHLAAKRSVPLGEKHPREFYDTNIWGTDNIVRGFPYARIINVSSSSAQEKKGAYGISKAGAEDVARLHRNCLTVRLYNVFGEGQLEESGALIPRVVGSVLRGEPIVIYGDGKQERDFTYVGDVVQELHALMFTEKATGLTHVGYSLPISVNAIVNNILMIMDKPEHPIEYQPARSYDILYSKSPISCYASIGRTEGLKRTVEWLTERFYRENPISA